MRTVANNLQHLLNGFIGLHLAAKHLHWVVRGRTFQQTHELLDEVVDVLQGHSDDIAERMAYLGVAPDPFNSAITLPYGFISDTRCHQIMSEALDSLSELCDMVYDNEKLDEATEDVVIAAQRDIDKYQWFFRSHL